jgi:O-antigen/teichoic acid export membrane protein
MAGLFASYLAIGAIFSVPAQPLSVLFRLMHFERVNLTLNISFVILKFAALWVGIYHNNLVVAIIGYSFVTIVSFVTTLFLIFNIVKQSKKILLMHTLIVLMLFTIIVLIRG